MIYCNLELGFASPQTLQQEFGVWTPAATLIVPFQPQWLPLFYFALSTSAEIHKSFTTKLAISICYQMEVTHSMDKLIAFYSYEECLRSLVLCDQVNENVAQKQRADT